jgi:hypothetical protein
MHLMLGTGKQTPHALRIVTVTRFAHDLASRNDNGICPQHWQSLTGLQTLRRPRFLKCHALHKGLGSFAGAGLFQHLMLSDREDHANLTEQLHATGRGGGKNDAGTSGTDDGGHGAPAVEKGN